MSEMIIAADSNMQAAQAYFSPLGEVRLVDGRKLTKAQLQDVNILLVRSVTRVDEKLLKHTPVEFVGTATSGTDHVDIDYLASQHIGFSRAPGANVTSVVEYVLSAIASCDDYLERLLAGEQVGIIGFGYVGRALAAQLQALGIAFVVYDPWLCDEQLLNPASLEQVLQCAVVSLHCELTTTEPYPSYHLLSASQLATMPSRSLLINASRGAVVDNKALYQLLKAGNGPQAVLDVWEGEPAVDAALLELVRFGTAHIAGYSYDGKLRASAILRDRLLAHLGRSQTEDVPLQQADCLRIPQGLTALESLRWLLTARYKIERDDQLLRQILSLQDPVAIGQLFDQLRRDYPARRELRGSPCSADDEEHSVWLQALSCKDDREGR